MRPLLRLAVLILLLVDLLWAPVLIGAVCLWLCGCGGSVDAAPTPVKVEPQLATPAGCGYDYETPGVCDPGRWPLYCDSQGPSPAEACQGPRWDAGQDLGWVWCCG